MRRVVYEAESDAQAALDTALAQAGLKAYHMNFSSLPRLGVVVVVAVVVVVVAVVVVAVVVVVVAVCSSSSSRCSCSCSSSSLP